MTDIAALTPAELDARVDALLRPGVVGTWPKHVEASVVATGLCTRCGHFVYEREADTPCHVPPLRWASAEPGTDEARVLAGKMLEELWDCARATVDTDMLVQVLLFPTGNVEICLYDADCDDAGEGECGPNLNVALARALLAAKEGAAGLG